jgi:hypothetical protein
VEQIVGIAQALEIPFDLVVEMHVGWTVSLKLIDEALSRQPLALHEVTIDVG